MRGSGESRARRLEPPALPFRRATLFLGNRRRRKKRGNAASNTRYSYHHHLMLSLFMCPFLSLSAIVMWRESQRELVKLALAVEKMGSTSIRRRNDICAVST